ncbi:MAG: hypothetical protein D6710_05370 [Nitrospirae bacterium]|nr:MAG: hypothetical protein D6710_05370 [Nitrospirota bacterium]
MKDKKELIERMSLSDGFHLKILIQGVCVFMKRGPIIGLFLLILFVSSAVYAQGLQAPICAKCHAQEQGVIRGFLDNISLRSNTIMINLLKDKVVVYFDDSTKYKYVKSLEDIANYKGKGFQINFVQRGDKKYAKEIIRFDILKRIKPEDRLTREDVKKLLGRKDVKLVDVRPPKIYKQAHIPGAVPVPAVAFDKFKKNLPEDKNQTIVLYGVGGCLSPTVAMNAMAEGYRNVKVYTGGFPDWLKTEIAYTTVDFVKKNAGKPHVVIVDLRDPSQASAGHIPGAVSIPKEKLSGAKKMFPEKKSAPIVFFGPGAEEAARTVKSWGYRKVFVAPFTLEQYQKAGGKVVSGALAEKIVYVPKKIPGTIDVKEFERIIKERPADTVLVDVRNPDETEEGKIEGARNIPLSVLEDLAEDIPKDKRVVLFCNTGVRAEMAYRMLKKKGYNAYYFNGLISFKDGKPVFEEQ